MYKLVDLLESDIKGNFYQAELQAVNKSEDTLWEVEKIIRKTSVKATVQNPDKSKQTLNFHGLLSG
jgi:hypothetical protein